MSGSETVDRIEEMLESAIAAPEGVDAAALAVDLALLPEELARFTLERVARRRGATVVALLEELAGLASGGLAVAAAQSLGLIRDAAAADALERLAGGAGRNEVRKAARRGLHRLASMGIAPSVSAPSPRERVQRAAWAAYRALAGTIDARGHRELLLALQAGAEIHLVGLLLSDEKGILTVNVEEMARSRFDRMAREFVEDPNHPAVEIPPDYLRHLVKEAHARNAAGGNPLPFGYLTWRERIGEPEQRYEQPLAYSVISSAEVRWDPSYLDRSGLLFDLEMFRAWSLPKEELNEFVRELGAARESGLVLAGIPAEARTRMVTDRAVQKLFDPGRRSLYKRRLEEMAYYLWKLGRAEYSRMALAAAMALEPPDRSLLSHPFVRRLVEWSLEVASQASRAEHTRAVKPGVRLHLPY